MRWMMRKEMMMFISTLERLFGDISCNIPIDKLMKYKLDERTVRWVESWAARLKGLWLVTWRLPGGQCVPEVRTGAILFNRNLMKLNKRKSQTDTFLPQFCSVCHLILLPVLWFITHSVLLEVITILLLHFLKLVVVVEFPGSSFCWQSCPVNVIRKTSSTFLLFFFFFVKDKW